MKWFVLPLLCLSYSVQAQVFTIADSGSLPMAMHFYQRGVEVIDSVKIAHRENGVPNRSDYWNHKERAFSYYRVSVICFEKVLDKEPENRAVMMALRQLYYRLEDTQNFELMTNRLRDQNVRLVTR
ncbi:MAG: hypothetical protein ACFB10_15540 [Salibacteraceae bacterium]